MANDIRTHLALKPRSGRAPRAERGTRLFSGKPIEEKPLWKDSTRASGTSFSRRICRRCSLTSKPIPVPDRLAVKPNPMGYRDLHLR